MGYGHVLLEFGDHGIKNTEVNNGEKRLRHILCNYFNTRKAKERFAWTANKDLNIGLMKTVQYFLAGRRH